MYNAQSFLHQVLSILDDAIREVESWLDDVVVTDLWGLVLVMK